MVRQAAVTLLLQVLMKIFRLKHKFLKKCVRLTKVSGVEMKDGIGFSSSMWR